MLVQTTLFDLSKFEKRRTSSQDEFEKNNHNLLIDFPEMVHLGHKRLHDDILSKIELRSRDNKLNATAMSGFLRGQLIEKYPNYCAKATKSRFKMHNDKSEWIFVKKLTSKKRPANIPTIANQVIINQLTDSDSDTQQNVFLGYTASKNLSHITGIYAVCIDGNKILWISDLIQYAKKEKLNPSIDITKQTKLKEGIVKIKTKVG